MKTLPYVRFLNLVRELNQSTPTLERCISLLAYVDDRQLAGKPVSSTDLVQKLDFGTGPTVYKKISQLIDSGYLKSTVNEDDARVKLLHITPEGHALLERYDSLMKQALLS